ncbi:MAG: hypothetical protein JWN06_2394 [Propionibacteriaceae bacterium]|nr:hypothetical protein [Propionibacteriaceae bacterium]
MGSACTPERGTAQRPALNSHDAPLMVYLVALSAPLICRRRQLAPPPEGALMLQEQPKPPEPPWRGCFTVSSPALAASVGSGDGPADIWLAQSPGMPG